jgi:hypothetical protein
MSCGRARVYGTARAPMAREMVSAAVRTAGPARSGFIRADQPETDSAPATWPPGPGLMHTVHGRQPRADVQELTDPSLTRQEPHRQREKRPVLAHHQGCAGHRFQQPGGGFPIGSEVVLATEQAIIDAGHVGRGHVQTEVANLARAGSLVSQESAFTLGTSGN